MSDEHRGDEQADAGHDHRASEPREIVDDSPWARPDGYVEAAGPHLGVPAAVDPNQPDPWGRWTSSDQATGSEPSTQQWAAPPQASPPPSHHEPPHPEQPRPTQHAPRGGRSRLGAAFSETPVTWSIIALCFLVWIGELVSPSFMDAVVLTPYLGRTEPWRFVTSAFAHALTPLHILCNMFCLWSLRQLEGYLGRARFLATYLLCAVAGGVCFVAMAQPSNPQSWFGGCVGASGAIFGLFGVLLFAYRDVHASTRQLWSVIAINMAISFTFPGIAWQAHLGGFAVGLAAGALIVRERQAARRGGRDHSWLWLGVLFVAVVVIAVAKYLMNPLGVPIS